MQVNNVLVTIVEVIQQRAVQYTAEAGGRSPQRALKAICRLRKIQRKVH